jgi:predicted GNAT family acetyltransferase
MDRADIDRADMDRADMDRADTDRDHVGREDGGTDMGEVRDNPERSRYELLIDGRLVGIADYRVVGDTMVFPHTEITPAERGRGHGAELVRAALHDVRARGRQVVPRCWYVAEFMDDNPEFDDLRAAS